MKLADRKTILLIVVGLSIAFIVTLFSPLASASPDGLERVAEDNEFIGTAKDAPYEIIADYVFPWVDNEDAATILAGITGVAIVAAVAFALGFGLQYWAGRSRATAGRTSGSGHRSPS